MLLNITQHGASVIENGTYFFSLNDYPNISSFEMHNILAFIAYEKANGRQTELTAKDVSILSRITESITGFIPEDEFVLPHKIQGCNACRDEGCLTKFVYHATDIDAAKGILTSGKLLSAVKVTGKTAEELAYEKRESLWNDPADYFEYIMFCWGNCITGENVVMSERSGGFIPGIRIYFRYDDILQHPYHTFDGYHCIKVKDEILLSDYLYAFIVPLQYKQEIYDLAPSYLYEKVHYISQDNLGIIDYSEKVYSFVEELDTIS